MRTCMRSMTCRPTTTTEGERNGCSARSLALERGEAIGEDVVMEDVCLEDVGMEDADLDAGVGSTTLPSRRKSKNRSQS